MKDFIEYLTDQFEAGKNDIARLEADGRKDDADFAKVRTNIYDKEWNAALDQAREHGDIRNTVIGEIKLEALDDVIAHFPEEEK